MPLLPLAFCWFTLFCFLVSPPISEARGTVAAKGRPTKVGNYGKHYNRTSPNKTQLDNYETNGVVNPHTGKVGTHDPFAAKMPRSIHGHP